MSERFNYHFDWDPAKAERNRRKHGITFEEAASVFTDPLMLTIPDQEHSQTEQRWVSLGRSGNGSLLVVVHTYDEAGPTEGRVRIISTRSATKPERRQYEAGT